MNLNEVFISQLKEAEFSGDISTQKSQKIIYSTDNSIYEIEPYGIIFPKITQDVELIFALLRQKKFSQIKITARGGGTSTNGQSINYGFIVDYSRYMNRILAIDPVAMTADVEPGVILDLLNKDLEKFNLYFPPNISPSNRATIGGMVNTDACGKGSCVHGRTSDNIAALNLHLLAEPSVISSELANKKFNAVLSPIIAKAKNLYSSKHLARTITGYNIEKSLHENGLDLNYLISGSEGTLALVSKIRVKLKKIPAKKRVVLLRYKNFDAALKDAQSLISLCPSAIETIDENVIRLARNDIIWQDVGHLVGDGLDNSVNILEFSYENEEEFLSHETFLNKALRGFDSEVEKSFLFEDYFLVSNKVEIANIWNLRKQGVGLLGAMKGKRRPLPFVEDTIVPPAELADYISSFRQILQKYGVVYGMFGHVDAGCLHVRPALNMRQQKDRELMRKISDDVCDLLLRHKGVIWGEHGKGFRSEYNEKFLGSEVTKIFSEIKRFFDPNDQLNSGKISSSTMQVPTVDSVATRGQFDENISSKIYDEFENILSCNGNALCFNFDKSLAMCPSYKISGDRRFSPKGRAMLFKEWLRKNRDLPSINNCLPESFFANFWQKILNIFRQNFLDEIHQSFSKCLGCKACNSQCPIKVSIPDAKSYFLANYFQKNFRKPQDYLIGNIEKLLLVFGKFPRVFNFITQNFLAKFVIGKIFAVTDILPIKSLKTSLNLDVAQNGEVVYLLRDSYSNYFYGDDLRDAWELLTKIGFQVKLSSVFDSGKALHAKGFLHNFIKVSAKNIADFRQFNGHILAIDPSLALSYRDEYRRFHKIEFEIFYLAEFLQKMAIAPILKDSNKVSLQKFHLILHCSEQSNIARIAEIWSEIFAKFNLKLSVVKAGCCGMSGSFGMESQNFSDSKNIFENNWEKLISELLKDENNVVMSAGSSCRSQVARFANFKLQNPISVLNSLI